MRRTPPHPVGALSGNQERICRVGAPSGDGAQSRPVGESLGGMSARGRYRWRTAVRRRLPWFLVDHGVAQKGKGDCGNHEWYRSTAEEDRCYHCDAGVRRPSQLGSDS